MIYVDSCKKKDSRTKRLSTINHSPPLPCLLKSFAKFWGVPGFRTGATSSLACPCNKYFSVSNSDISVYLASLCIGYTNLHLVILVVTTIINRRGNMGIWMPQRSWIRKHPCPHPRCLCFLIEGLESKAASPWFNGLLEHLF